MASGMRVAGAISSLFNARSLQLECGRVLQESLLVPVPTYDSEKERSKIRAVQMDNLRGLLGIRRMDKVLNVWIRQLCRLTKGVDEKINEGVLQWFSHVETMENNRIAKRVYVREYDGSRGLAAEEVD